MKFLISLSLFQTILLAFLGLRVIDMDARLNNISNNASASNRPVATTETFAATQYASQIAPQSPSADEIRAIIREEAAILAAKPASTDNQYTVQHRENKKQTAQTRYLIAEISQSLDYHIGRGAINEVDMTNLQMKIARLPPEERTAIMKRLTKAMNAGELDGRF